MGGDNSNVVVGGESERITETTVVKPFHAYFVGLLEAEGLPSQISFDTWIPTDISSVRCDAVSPHHQVYDLQGRKLSPLTSHPSPLKKGIYIVDGKKIINP